MQQLRQEETEIDLGNIHPGEVLREDFLVPMSLTAYRLSKSIGVPQTRIAGILKGERSITADTAHRLARFFGTSAQLWLNLQNHYDLEKAAAQNHAEYERIPAHA